MLPQENEAIAEAFTQAHRDFEPLDAGELLAQLKVPEAASLCSGGESGSRRAPVAAPPPDRRVLCRRLTRKL
jgi:16S rRNA C967 or C1407 C5-methylase (RsmB/RsmF family)